MDPSRPVDSDIRFRIGEQRALTDVPRPKKLKPPQEFSFQLRKPSVRKYKRNNARAWSHPTKPSLLSNPRWLHSDEHFAWKTVSSTHISPNPLPSTRITISPWQLFLSEWSAASLLQLHWCEEVCAPSLGGEIKIQSFINCCHRSCYLYTDVSVWAGVCWAWSTKLGLLLAPSGLD